MTRTERVARGFDRLSGVYEPLAGWLSAGRIPASQTRWCSLVADRQRALVLGGGAGGFLAALLDAGFAGRVVYVDLSAGMLARARRRIRNRCDGATGRVEFRCGGIERIRMAERFDLVCTHYVLDLFVPPELDAIVERIARAIEPGGVWLCSDFAPPSGSRIRRAAQRAVLRLLYVAFGTVCGTETRHLPPIEAALAARGFHPFRRGTLAAGWLWTAALRRARAVDPASTSPGRSAGSPP